MPRWLDPLLNPLACLPDLLPSVASHETAEHLLKRLEALLLQKLRYAASGEKKSLMRGQGLDFADLREYVPGDDVRKIDWNVFARTLTPHIREYHEEKQLTLWLVIDLTASMQFGRKQAKQDRAIELAGLLGLMAHQANHRLGAFLIQQDGTRIIPPKSSYGHLQALIQTLQDVCVLPSTSQTIGQTDPLPAACAQLGHLIQKHSTVLFLSDFLSLSNDWVAPLGQLSRSCRLIYPVLQDPVEKALPAGLGMLSFIDPETGDLCCFDTNDASLRHAYTRQAQAHHAKLLAQLNTIGTAVSIPTEADLSDNLLALVEALSRPGRRQAG